MQRNMAVLENGANCYRELLFAACTLPYSVSDVSFALRLRIQPIGIIHHATMRANRAIRPAYIFQEGAGLLFAVEIGCKIG